MKGTRWSPWKQTQSVQVSLLFISLSGFSREGGSYLSLSLTHFNVLLSILKELFTNPKIEQREGKTKEDSNLRNKSSLGRLGLNWKKDIEDLLNCVLNCNCRHFRPWHSITLQRGWCLWGKFMKTCKTTINVQSRSRKTLREVSMAT